MPGFARVDAAVSCAASIAETVRVMHLEGMEQITTMPGMGSLEALAWDEGCQNDPVRNEFLIPKLAKILATERPATVLDVGAGTGYIPRIVDSHLDYHPQWTLVDTNAERMELAEKRKLPAMKMLGVVGSLDDIVARSETYNVVMLTFTLLETDNPLSMVASATGLLAENGLVIIGVPDVWRDVLAVTGAGQVLPYQLLTGTVDLPKIDKFTGAAYPFYAMRTESLISAVLSHFCVLEKFERGGPRGEAYLLVFRQQRRVRSATPRA